MLYLVGIGLNSRQLTLEALEAIGHCSQLFIENYTSLYSQGTILELERVIGQKIVSLDRKSVEEKFDTLFKTAQKHNIGLLIFGNPLFATTHVQLLLDAKGHKMETRVIAGISIQNYLGSTGLDAYKFGRVITVVFQESHYAPESFFDFLETNSKNGLHTLCLLDIRSDENRFMTISQAVETLRKIAHKRNSKLLDEATLVGLYGIGNENQKIKSGNAEQLLEFKTDLLPQSLIVCGRLNEKEFEAISKLNNEKK